jgi:hypothetical protein
MSYTQDKAWSFTQDQVINRALAKVGEYDSGENAPNEEKTDAQFMLNAMVSEWAETLGVGLWLRQRIILILQQTVQTYRLGPTGTTGTNDNFHAFVEEELIEAKLTGAAAATDTTLTITDSTWVDSQGQAVPIANLLATDNIGIRLDNGGIHWSTVLDPADSATTITINDAMPSAAKLGARVYTYTNRTPRPHGIVNGWRRTVSGTDRRLTLIGRADYDLLSQKDNNGEPTQANFIPRLAADGPIGDYSELAVWPVVNPASLDKLVLLGEFYPDILSGDSTNPQFPRAWASALIWGLANEIGDEYEVSIQRMNRIERIAAQKFQLLAAGADREDASVYLGGSREGG